MFTLPEYHGKPTSAPLTLRSSMNNHSRSKCATLRTEMHVLHPRPHSLMYVPISVLRCTYMLSRSLEASPCRMENSQLLSAWVATSPETFTSTKCLFMLQHPAPHRPMQSGRREI